MPHHTEIYPMRMFPTFSVADIEVSASWYTDRVGFSRVFAIPGEDGEVALEHLRWSRRADLLLVPETGSSQAFSRKGVGVALSFLSEEETVEDMAARLKTSGVEIEEGPIDRPWNTRDVVILDPDGYRLIFFEPIDVFRTFDKVIGSAGQQS